MAQLTIKPGPTAKEIFCPLRTADTIFLKNIRQKNWM